MNFLILGLDSLIACIAIGAIVGGRSCLPLAPRTRIGTACSSLTASTGSGSGLCRKTGWVICAERGALSGTRPLLAFGQQVSDVSLTQ
jgi:hypothetical protein